MVIVYTTKRIRVDQPQKHRGMDGGLRERLDYFLQTSQRLPIIEFKYLSFFLKFKIGTNTKWCMLQYRTRTKRERYGWGTRESLDYFLQTSQRPPIIEFNYLSFFLKFKIGTNTKWYMLQYRTKDKLVYISGGYT